MLKKIDVSQLRVGMFFERAEGAWLDHQLWRRSFLIKDAAQLAAVLQAGVQSCWIDTRRGLDVDVAAEPAAPSAPAAPIAHLASVTPAAVVVPSEPVSLASEMKQAQRLCQSARAAVAGSFADIRRGVALDTAPLQPVVDEVVASVFRHATALASLARIKKTDDYTYMHSVAVCALMVGLGRQLGFDRARCQVAGLAGLLHDVGKARVPLAVLNKPGPLSDEEWGVMRRHPALGHALLAQGGVDDTEVLEVCLRHHEKMDGSGYPGQQAGDALPLLVRMGAVCDVYDAVTSQRPYKTGWDPAVALVEMARWRGHFDRPVLAAFIQLLGVYPAGSLVRLASGRLAVVIENQPERLRSPRVRVFYSTRSNEPVPVHTLDLDPRLTNDKIVAVEPREHWPLPQLDALVLGGA